jgi:predicted glycosyltransferase
MKVLFDLKHPAQAQFFKDAIAILRDEGHEILVTSRAKDETTDLLDALSIPHIRLSSPAKGFLGMGLELARRTARLIRIARRFRPDVMVARTGVSIGPAGKVLRVPTIVFDDTEFAWLQISLSATFATVICTGLGYERRFRGKELRFNAPPHLAGTHPKRFTPSAEVLRRHGVEAGEPYIVLRFKSWSALHDAGVRGPRDEEICRLVDAVRAYGRPIVSTERPLPAELRGYVNPVPVDGVYHLLAFAQLYVGEGACMATEAACLGTPGIWLSPSSRRGSLDAIERRYGHVTTVQTVPQAIERARAWLEPPGMKGRAMAARDRLVAECDDPVEFALEVIRRYGRRLRQPGSGG